MRKICFYIMRHDSGFAPNPFHRFCTLAACTPNHMRAKLAPGDFIAGVFRSGKAPRLVYAMEVEEVLDLESYYHDRRFRRKKPSKHGAWTGMVGDNIYYIGANGKLRQHSSTVKHTTESLQRQDIHGNRVFIGRRFVYFGAEAKLLPQDFTSYLPASRGIKYLSEAADAAAFRKFLGWRHRLGAGIRGLPRDCKPATCVGTRRATKCAENSMK